MRSFISTSSSSDARFDIIYYILLFAAKGRRKTNPLNLQENEENSHCIIIISPTWIAIHPFELTPKFSWTIIYPRYLSDLQNRWQSSLTERLTILGKKTRTILYWGLRLLNLRWNKNSFFALPLRDFKKNILHNTQKATNLMPLLLHTKEDAFKVFCGIDFYFPLIALCKTRRKEGDTIESRQIFMWRRIRAHSYFLDCIYFMYYTYNKWKLK